MEHVNVGIEKPNTKATRKRLTFAQKLDILTRLEKGEKQITLAKEVGCSTRAISRLKQQRNFFEHLSLEPGETHRKSWHTSRNAQLETHLTEFLETLKRTGFPIFSNVVRRAALRIRDELLGDKKGHSEERVALSGFQASANWAKAFIKRKRLRGMRSSNTEGERNGGDAPAREEFVERLKGYDMDCVMAVQSFNLFYKLLPWDMATDSQAVSEGDAESSRRHDLKDRVVVLVGCNATGSFKIPGTMIWKKDTGGHFSEGGCRMGHIYQAYAVLDADVLKTWFVSVLLPGVRQYTRKKVGVIVPCDWPYGMVDKEGQVELIKAEFWKDGGCGPLQNVSRFLRRRFRYDVGGVLNRVWKCRSASRSGFDGLSDAHGLVKGESANLTDVSDLLGSGWGDVSEEYLRNCWIGCGILGQDAREEGLGRLDEGFAEEEARLEARFDENMGSWLAENGVGRKEFDAWLGVEESARGVRGLGWEIDEMVRNGIVGKAVGRVARLTDVQVEKSEEEGSCLPSLAHLMDLIHPIEMVLVENSKPKAASLVRLLKLELLREYPSSGTTEERGSLNEVADVSCQH